MSDPTEVSTQDECDLSTFNQDINLLTACVNERTHRCDRKWAPETAQEIVHLRKKVLEELQLSDDPSLFSAEDELEQFPLARQVAEIVLDPNDQIYKAILTWASSIVPLQQALHVPWVRFTGRKPIIVTNVDKNKEINQKNYQTRQDMDKKYNGKVFKCPYCGFVPRPEPKRSRVIRHMNTCKKKTNEEKEPVDVTFSQCFIMHKVKKNYTPEEREAARREANKRTVERRKKERALKRAAATVVSNSVASNSASNSVASNSASNSAGPLESAGESNSTVEPGPTTETNAIVSLVLAAESVSTAQPELTIDLNPIVQQVSVVESGSVVNSESVVESTSTQLLDLTSVPPQPLEICHPSVALEATVEAVNSANCIFSLFLSKFFLIND